MNKREFLDMFEDCLKDKSIKIMYTRRSSPALGEIKELVILIKDKTTDNYNVYEQQTTYY